MAPWEIPIRELMSLQERMNRLFDESIVRAPEEQRGESTDWVPKVDVYELEAALVLDIELPGLEREDVSVDIEASRLRVHGQRRAPSGVERQQFHRRERSYGAFSRSFDLPASVDVEEVRAEYRNGVLSIRLPKRNENRVKHVSIKID